VYQTYTYNGFPSSQPLTNNNANNFIKINTNYVSPLDKFEQKSDQNNQYQANGIDCKQK
jgi:hypothetical protein